MGADSVVSRVQTVAAGCLCTRGSVGGASFGGDCEHSIYQLRSTSPLAFAQPPLSESRAELRRSIWLVRCDRLSWLHAVQINCFMPHTYRCHTVNTQTTPHPHLPTPVGICKKPALNIICRLFAPFTGHLSNYMCSKSHGDGLGPCRVSVLNHVEYLACSWLYCSG